MKHAILATLIATAGVVLLSSAAPAQQCVSMKKVANGLFERHGEVAISAGLSQRGHITALFANPETGTWTAVAFNPAGCLVATLDAGFGMKSPSDEFMPSLLHGTRS